MLNLEIYAIYENYYFVVVIKGKGGQTRAIDLSAKQRSIITKYLDYARCSGRYSRDYLISASEKDGVKREKRSLQNWMSYNRKSYGAFKFTITLKL